jgi:hypothetical protein
MFGWPRRALCGTHLSQQLTVDLMLLAPQNSDRKLPTFPSSAPYEYEYQVPSVLQEVPRSLPSTDVGSSLRRVALCHVDQGQHCKQSHWFIVHTGQPWLQLIICSLTCSRARSSPTTTTQSVALRNSSHQLASRTDTAVLLWHCAELRSPRGFARARSLFFSQSSHRSRALLGRAGGGGSAVVCAHISLLSKSSGC